MSLAFDAASGSQNVDKTGSGTVSWTHTPVGTPKVATVNIQWAFDVNNVGLIYITGITYGGVAMTQVGSLVSGATATNEKWILLNPPTGAQSVVITWVDDFTPLDNALGRANSTTYTAGNAATYGTLQTATGTTTPITKAVSNVRASSTLDTQGSVYDGSSGNITITVNGTGETKRSGVTNFGAVATTGRCQVYCSTQTGSGTVTANATESANRTWAIMVLELQEVVFGGPSMMMMGVGV